MRTTAAASAEAAATAITASVAAVSAALPADAAGLAALAPHYTRLRQPRKALELYDTAVTQGLAREEVFPAVMRALLKLQRTDLALALHRRHVDEAGAPDTRSATTLLLALCRCGELESAATLLRELDAIAAAAPPPQEPGGQEPLEHAVSSAMVPALALAHLRRGQAAEALAFTSRVARVGGGPGAPPLHTLTQLARECGKARSVRGVYDVLDGMGGAGYSPDAECKQVLVDALVGSCAFVKGGVSMETLPAGALPEVAFIGRSNVGKSSLVNMVLGRRAIAYTSKTPGKTQQYNYFVLNAGRAEGAFHLVDMPGLGFAKVPTAQRKAWLAFLRTYAVSRAQLRLFVHLVDGRDGPQETDLELMRMVANAQAEPEPDRQGEAGGAGGAADAADGRGRGWGYAIVLTKVDKLGGTPDRAVVDAVARAVASTGVVPVVPPVPTSSKSKLGRDDVWRLLRCVMLEEGGAGGA